MQIYKIKLKYLKTTCKVAKNSSCRDAEIFIEIKNAKNEAKWPLPQVTLVLQILNYEIDIAACL